ncbi:MAG: DUF2207 domain-containing protein, partial [Nitriliruptorales bacterium]|nr:DUF2207 domain-containing protein [Nitriliruptorales bacterium]
MRRVVVLAAVTVAMASATFPARAQSGWTIDSFDVVMAVAADGTFEVTETIAVDFGSLTRHGIYRDIPVRYELPPDPPFELPDPDLEPADYLRAIDIDEIRVSSRSAPDEVEITRPGPTGGEWLRIRIGDPDRTISGPHTYTIRYRVRGAFDRFDGGPELFWDVTGNDWEAPIRRAAAVVIGPPAAEAACFRGVYGASGTCTSRLDSDRVFVTADDLRPGEGMTLSVRYSEGAVELPPPILEEKWS